jgi:hypothetical protein
MPLAEQGISTRLSTKTMIVQLGNAYNAAFYAAFSSDQRQKDSTQTANTADTVSISEAARRLQAEDSAEAVPITAPIDARLAAIQATPPSERTAEDIEYQRSYDSKLAAIMKKNIEHPGSLTGAEIDYWQKAGRSISAIAKPSLSLSA